MNYNNFKLKIKQIVKFYTFGIQFIEFIDQYTFNTQIQEENKIISIQFVKEIISQLDLNSLDILTKISDFNKYYADGDLFNVWKIIYIKLYNPIIIIGAGVSGLTIGAGINDENILILEARDRIGGRVYTNEKNMDMGAGWIHGLTNNPLNKFLNPDNLIPISTSNPWMHSENILIKYLTNKQDITEEQRQELAIKWNGIISKISKLKDKTIIEGFEEIKEDNNQETDEQTDLYSFLYMCEVWCGGSIKNISTDFFNECEFNNKNALFGDYAGSHCLFKNGAKTLIDSIINSANNIDNIFDKIKFNQVVTKIINHDYYVQVCTNDGYIYNCNKLCIGIPPGPLKNIIFDPPLSSTKLNSLSKIQMGSYKKIQLEFNEADIFWDEQIPMFLTSNSKITGKEYYLNKNNDNKVNKDDKDLFPYILWNNYKYSKNKPILEAICPADIGWKLAGQTDEEIIDVILSQLNNYFPNVPEPKA